MPKKPLSELTEEEWAQLIATGMAYEFYPEGPPVVDPEGDGSDIIHFGEDSD